MYPAAVGVVRVRQEDAVRGPDRADVDDLFVQSHAPGNVALERHFVLLGEVELLAHGAGGDLVEVALS